MERPDQHVAYAESHYHSPAAHQRAPLRRVRSKRIMFTLRHLFVLTTAYLNNPYPDRFDCGKIARHLGVEPQKVASWFTNKRWKDRKKNLICSECRYFKAPIGDNNHDQDPYSRPCMEYFAAVVSQKKSRPGPVNESQSVAQEVESLDSTEEDELGMESEQTFSNLMPVLDSFSASDSSSNNQSSVALDYSSSYFNHFSSVISQSSPFISDSQSLDADNKHAQVNVVNDVNYGSQANRENIPLQSQQPPPLTAVNPSPYNYTNHVSSIRATYNQCARTSGSRSALQTIDYNSSCYSSRMKLNYPSYQQFNYPYGCQMSSSNQSMFPSFNNVPRYPQQMSAGFYRQNV